MWLTISELADYLRVSKETIYKLAQQAQIPASKIGNQWRFRRDLVDDWFAGKSEQTNPPRKRTGRAFNG